MRMSRLLLIIIIFVLFLLQWRSTEHVQITVCWNNKGFMLSENVNVNAMIP